MNLSLHPVQLSQEFAEAIAAEAENLDTSGGLASLAPLFDSRNLFAEVRQGAEVVARYVVSLHDHDGLREACIVAAVGGAPGLDLTRDALPLIERQLAAVDCVTIETRRPGLVRKLRRLGYSLDSMVMRKRKGN